MDSSPGAQTGSRMVEPRRSRRRSPSDRRREARRIAERIEAASRERVAARSEGRALDAERLTTDLLGPDLGPYSPGGLYGDKRAARREVYQEAPDLEGSPTYRHAGAAVTARHRASMIRNGAGL